MYKQVTLPTVRSLYNIPDNLMLCLHVLYNCYHGYHVHQPIKVGRHGLKCTIFADVVCYLATKISSLGGGDIIAKVFFTEGGRMVTAISCNG